MKARTVPEPDRLKSLHLRGIARPAVRPLSPRQLPALLQPLPHTALLGDALRDERAKAR
jgi:hypothetical protein